LDTWIPLPSHKNLVDVTESDPNLKKYLSREKQLSELEMERLQARINNSLTNTDCAKKIPKEEIKDYIKFAEE